jgi:SAM-dependent methyltransferase
VNLARERIYRKIGENLSKDSRVLLIGCGQQRRGLDVLCHKANAQFLLTDIDHQADCDIYCDAHELPFADGSFDGVVITAVIECVMDPWLVAQEITRVVKEGGFVYSEAPFLQGVQEGAYDFTRFTLGGHRALFRGFREVEAGAVSGPGTSFVWATVGLAESVFRHRRMAQLANAATRCGVAWIKYLDRWIANRPLAEDFASGTYFWGVKIREKASVAEVVSRYRGRRFTH